MIAKKWRAFLPGILISLSLSVGVFADSNDAIKELVAKDRRLSGVRDTDTDMTMTPFASRAEWDPYADSLRFRIRVACGLWPEPEHTPLNTKVFDTIEREGYSVSKVYFEAFPGFLVTGNLYVPAGKGPFPAVLNPHGHWRDGRLENTDKCSVPGRCITFAKMGMVAFSVDMVGYNDSRQFSFAWGHKPKDIPVDVRRQQELWGIDPFSVQLWSNIRALDFLQSLPQVDPKRLACTGASGGGTQTFALCAVDSRVQVAAPVNMISHTMQGGCACENVPLIRISASNMEIGALFAPKPLMMVAATGDWTKDTPKVEFPAIRGIYDLMGAADHVESLQIDAGHNYNKLSREAVYRFMGKWFLNQPEKYATFTEPAFTVEPKEALRVFPGEGPLPDHLTQDQVIEAMIRERRERIAREVKEHGKEPEFVEKYRQAVGDMIGVDVTRPIKVEAEKISSKKYKGDTYTVENWILRVPDTGAVIPAVLLVPDSRTVGTPDLFTEQVQGNGDFRPPAFDFVREGHMVASIDVFHMGVSSHLTPRHIGKFPDTFVPTDIAYQTQDVLAGIQWLSERGGNSPVNLREVHGRQNVWCAIATALSPVAVSTSVVSGVFDLSDERWAKDAFLPCLQSLGGIATIVAVLAPERVNVGPGSIGLF